MELTGFPVRSHACIHATIALVVLLGVLPAKLVEYARFEIVQLLRHCPALMVDVDGLANAESLSLACTKEPIELLNLHLLRMFRIEDDARTCVGASDRDFESFITAFRTRIIALCVRFLRTFLPVRFMWNVRNLAALLKLSLSGGLCRDDSPITFKGDGARLRLIFESDLALA